MRIRTLLMVMTVTVILGGMSWAAGQQARNQGQNQGQAPTTPAATAGELTAMEMQNILHMREEEKLARDVYLTCAELWKDCPVFANIAESEKRHMAAVGLLITKYGLTDPVTDDTIGVFSKPEFTTLYTTLTESGAKSLVDALKAGVQIEELDIADLKQALLETDKSDIQWVFTNLLRGSTNHLRAFTRNVETGGTACLLQAGSGNAGKGPQGAGNPAGQGRGRGRGGRGNGNGCCLGTCGGAGNGSQNGTCQQNQQQKRDGTCLLVPPTAPAQP